MTAVRNANKKDESFSFRIQPTLLSEFRAYCKERDLSMGDELRRAVKEVLRNRDIY